MLAGGIIPHQRWPPKHKMNEREISLTHCFMYSIHVEKKMCITDVATMPSCVLFKRFNEKVHFYYCDFYFKNLQ